MKHFSWLSLIVPFLALASAAPVVSAAAPETPPLQTCLEAAADYSPVYPTRVFPAGTTHGAVAVVRLGRGEKYRTLTASWIAVDVGNAAPSNLVINKTDMDLTGRDRAAVRMRSRAGALPPGKYRLDVTADGKPWRSVEFSVAPLPRPEVTQPSDLMPLSPGTVWRYAFAQQFSDSIKSRLPANIKLDPEGKFRAALTKSATGADKTGTHIESRRDNVLVEEEWLQLTTAGLVVAQVKSGDEIGTIDPPSVMWPWPLKTPQEWFYTAPDQSFKQRYRMWGSVPVKGPAGEAPGYVVLMDQPSPDVTLTVERHYLPGVGMVRETVIQARNGAMLTRWDNVLTARP